jgi:hypothetical protein
LLQKTQKGMALATGLAVRSVRKGNYPMPSGEAMHEEALTHCTAVKA